MADHGSDNCEGQRASEQEAEDGVSPSLDGHAARTGSDAGTDLNVSPRSPVDSVSAYSPRPEPEDDDQQGDDRGPER